MTLALLASFAATSPWHTSSSSATSPNCFSVLSPTLLNGKRHCKWHLILQHILLKKNSPLRPIESWGQGEAKWKLCSCHSYPSSHLQGNQSWLDMFPAFQHWFSHCLYFSRSCLICPGSFPRARMVHWMKGKKWLLTTEDLKGSSIIASVIKYNIKICSDSHSRFLNTIVRETWLHPFICDI